MLNLDEIENKVLLGSCETIGKQLPPQSVQCIVTSPPYWGHRNYSNGNSSELGREDTIDDYVHDIANALTGLRDSLKNDGLLWLNLGDTYKDKELQGVPWKVAIELQQQGWILRSDVIWHKPNAMPSSVTSRPTVDHEYIFMFSKSKSYYYDADAIREEHITFTEKSKMRGGRNHFGKKGGTPEEGKNSGNHNLHDGRWDQAFNPKGRNKRTVWSVPLGKFRGAHFAVFPEKLIEPCILASTKKGDIVLDPFSGSGTTGIVAIKNGRKYVGIELVSEYQKMGQDRIDALL